MLMSFTSTITDLVFQTDLDSNGDLDSQGDFHALSQERTLLGHLFMLWFAIRKYLSLPTPEGILLLKYLKDIRLDPYGSKAMKNWAWSR